MPNCSVYYIFILIATESTGNLQLTSTNSILLNTTMISSTSVPVWRTQRPSLGGYGSGGGGGGGTSGLNIGQSSSPVDRSSPPGVTGLSLRITPFPLVTVHRGERLEFQCAVVRDDEGAGPRRGRSQQHTLEWQYRPNRSGQWQDLKKGKSKKKRLLYGCTCVCVVVWVCGCVCVLLCGYVDVWVCVWMYMCVDVHVCVYICIYASGYAYAWADLTIHVVFHINKDLTFTTYLCGNVVIH